MNETNPVTEEVFVVAPETPERRAETETKENASEEATTERKSEEETAERPSEEAVLDATASAEAEAADTFTFTFDQEGNAVIIEAPENVKVELVTEETTPEKDPTPLDNAITLGLVGVLAAAVVALVIRKIAKNKKPAAAAVEEVPVAPAADAPTAPGAAGEVKLNNVDPKTAAMLMAIVADKMQKPINELRFISIKEVE